MFDQGELPQVWFPLPKQHRWPSVMRRLRVRGWWQKIHGSGSKSVKSTWIEAWSLADRILLEALHFLQITCHMKFVTVQLIVRMTKTSQIATSHFLTVRYNIISCAHLGMYMSTYSPASFCMVQVGFGFSEKMRSNIVKTCNSKHRVSRV